MTTEEFEQLLLSAVQGVALPKVCILSMSTDCVKISRLPLMLYKYIGTLYKYIGTFLPACWLCAGFWQWAIYATFCSPHAWNATTQVKLSTTKSSCSNGVNTPHPSYEWCEKRISETGINPAFHSTRSGSQGEGSQAYCVQAYLAGQQGGVFKRLEGAVGERLVQI